MVETLVFGRLVLTLIYKRYIGAEAIATLLMVSKTLKSFLESYVTVISYSKLTILVSERKAKEDSLINFSL